MRNLYIRDQQDLRLIKFDNINIVKPSEDSMYVLNTHIGDRTIYLGSFEKLSNARKVIDEIEVFFKQPEALVLSKDSNVSPKALSKTIGLTVIHIEEMSDIKLLESDFVYHIPTERELIEKEVKEDAK